QPTAARAMMAPLRLMPSVSQTEIDGHTQADSETAVVTPGGLGVVAERDCAGRLVCQSDRCRAPTPAAPRQRGRPVSNRVTSSGRALLAGTPFGDRCESACSTGYRIRRC